MFTCLVQGVNSVVVDFGADIPMPFYTAQSFNSDAGEFRVSEMTSMSGEDAAE